MKSLELAAGLGWYGVEGLKMIQRRSSSVSSRTLQPRDLLKSRTSPPTLVSQDVVETEEGGGRCPWGSYRRPDGLWAAQMVVEASEPGSVVSAEATVGAASGSGSPLLVVAAPGLATGADCA